ncbi:hypothetical protein NUU61_002181 [Penicillium alfredii]|uniref:SsDNA binding protein n=1 Tax=Penicillium alfredii TaxID=1506179 RepID=A0A9W9KFR1_9EURO|nr:uncharacterized protein NUU61_002181 [Penicillium alfredii]KAJ5104834.1 hypothetical protein NUU61_002181 [Penicillium alfredii]
MSAFASLLRPSLRMATPATSTARTFSSSAARSLARMSIVGRLGAAPELSVTSTGLDLVKYSIATDTGPRDKRETSWFRVGTILDESKFRDFMLALPKGTLVLVECEARMKDREDADGKKYKTLTLAQRSIEVLRRPANISDSNESEFQSESRPE